MEQLISIAEASTLLGLRESTIRKYVMLRVLPHRKLGRRVLFSPSEIERWVADRRIAPLSEESNRTRCSSSSRNAAPRAIG